MSYRKPLNASLINVRQYRKYNFSPTAYDISSSSQAEIVIGSGSDYVSGPNSYIVFDVFAPTSDNTARTNEETRFASEDIKGCSAMNLFKTCTITHRSGDQIDRTTNLNSLAQSLLLYSNGEDYLRKYAGAIGAGSPKVGDEAKTTYDNLTIRRKYVLPLWLFSGFFAQEALIPGNAMGGCRITLEFAKFAEAIGAPLVGAKKSTTLQISNMGLVLDSYNPFDSVMSELKDAQGNVKSQGLQFSYYGYHNLCKPITTSLQFDLNFAAGMVLQLIAKVRQGKNAIGTENVGALPFGYTEVQARLGSLPFPRHVITSASEAYNQTISSFESTPVLDAVDIRKSSIGPSYRLYSGLSSEAGDGETVPTALAQNGVPVIAWDMENSEIVRLSGNLTNNSRLLSLDGVVVSVTDQVLDVWIKYAKVLNVMMDNVTINR